MHEWHFRHAVSGETPWFLTSRMASCTMLETAVSQAPRNQIQVPNLSENRSEYCVRVPGSLLRACVSRMPWLGFRYDASMSLGLLPSHIMGRM